MNDRAASWIWPAISFLCLGLLGGFFAGSWYSKAASNPRDLAGAVAGAVIDTLNARMGSAPRSSEAQDQFGTTIERAYMASMRSDLRNLVVAEEAYFADSVKYTSKLGSGGLTFYVTSGNTAPVITLTSDGWTATIGNVNTRYRCAIFIGSTRLAPAVREGEPKCE